MSKVNFKLPVSNKIARICRNIKTIYKLLVNEDIECLLDDVHRCIDHSSTLECDVQNGYEELDGRIVELSMGVEDLEKVKVDESYLEDELERLLNNYDFSDAIEDCLSECNLEDKLDVSKLDAYELDIDWETAISDNIDFNFIVKSVIEQMAEKLSR